MSDLLKLYSLYEKALVRELAHPRGNAQASAQQVSSGIARTSGASTPSAQMQQGGQSGLSALVNTAGSAASIASLFV